MRERAQGCARERRTGLLYYTRTARADTGTEGVDESESESESVGDFG